MITQPVTAKDTIIETTMQNGHTPDKIHLILQVG